MHIAILLAGLTLNFLAPIGYMVAPSPAGWPSVVVCPETHPLARLAGPVSETRGAHTGKHTGTMDHAAMGHEQGGDTTPSSSQSKDCAFSGALDLTAGAIDPGLLSATIVYLLLLGIASSRPVIITERRYMRPPLRGPPISI